MKTILKFYVLMTIPVLLLSCGTRPKQTSDKVKDMTGIRSDTGMRDTTNMARGGAMMDNGTDNDFIMEAASGGMLEVQLGKYAQNNAQNIRVKNFGAMMVRDHSKVNDELKVIASGKSITFPGTMNDKHHDVMTDLQDKKGAEFDKDYMDEMVDDHEKDIDKFKKQAEKGMDPDLKAFAAKTLPVLLMHLDSAKNIREAVKR